MKKQTNIIFQTLKVLECLKSCVLIVKIQPRLAESINAGYMDTEGWQYYWVLLRWLWASEDFHICGGPEPIPTCHEGGMLSYVPVVKEGTKLVLPWENSCFQDGPTKRKPSRLILDKPSSFHSPSPIPPLASKLFICTHEIRILLFSRCYVSWKS